MATLTASQFNPTGNISGLKFNDINANGRLDPNESGLPNFTIYLDINNNGSLDFNEPANITNSFGGYLFNNVPPNIYTIREIQQPGFNQTTPTPIVNVTPGSNLTNINIGNSGNVSNRGSISGIKFNDTNTNGRLDPGENGLADITLYLDLNQNGFLDEGEPPTITGVNGEYSFQDLPPNTYILREVSPPDFDQTTPDPILNVTSGSNLTVNIGNVSNRGQISGTKFNDTNTNGRLDPGELGLADITLYLDLNQNGFLDEGEPPTITGINGEYSFRDLPPNTYILREISPPGFAQTTPDPILNVTPGSNLTNINIGNVNNRGEISGTKFNDTNTNGRLDPGENGLQDITLYLDINQNGFLDEGEPPTITGINGEYSFQDLPPNTYIIRETQTPDFDQTTADPIVNVTPGSNITNVNIGNVNNRGQISGTKFNDTNTNGRFDPGELGLADITLYLDLNQNGFLDEGEPPTITGVNGEYSFRDLPPNSYILREISPPGFAQTTPDPIVNVTSGSNLTNINIGNVNNRGQISGTKFNDTNTNGIFDPGENGLANITLYLDLNQNGFFDDGEPPTITDVNGEYSFRDLPPDTYTIRETQAPDFDQTTPDPIINVTPGSDITNVNIGNVSNRGEINGIKFNDRNANGILDPGENGLGNFTLYLDLNNNSLLDIGEPATITDEFGFYSFEDLPPNTYTIGEVPKFGFSQTTADPVVDVIPGSDINNVNIGNFSEFL
ncbi:MAG: SdrD B-like domain-containing protein [Trichodesmium sp. MO_231.B1]|nr:SdrD B-like domain-containing protein [Trichodesmium sp. MO_231.B1]